MKQRIRLTESDLHKIVKESVKRVLNEVSLKGKTGDEYSLHGDNYDAWATLAKLRKRQLNIPNRIMTGREEDAYKRDADNWTDLLNDYAMYNKYGLKADRIKDYSDINSDFISGDILHHYDPNAYDRLTRLHTLKLPESDLHRIIKESVNRIILEHGRGNDWDKREEMKNFQDPLLSKKNRRGLISDCKKILGSPLFRLLEKYGFNPILSLQITDSSNGDISKSKDSNDLNELIAFCKENANIPTGFDIFGFLYADDKISYNDWNKLSHREIAAKYGVPVVAVEILSEISGCINIEDYDYYEPKIDAIIRRYTNNKRLG